jgi:hypothetical protein
MQSQYPTPTSTGDSIETFTAVLQTAFTFLALVVAVAQLLLNMRRN